MALFCPSLSLACPLFEWAATPPPCLTWQRPRPFSQCDLWVSCRDWGSLASEGPINSFNQLGLQHPRSCTNRPSLTLKGPHSIYHPTPVSIWNRYRKRYQMESSQHGGAVKILRGSNFSCPYLYAEPVVCFERRAFMIGYPLPRHWWAFICLTQRETWKVKEASTAELSQPPTSQSAELEIAAVPHWPQMVTHGTGPEETQTVMFFYFSRRAIPAEMNLFISLLPKQFPQITPYRAICRLLF